MSRAARSLNPRRCRLPYIGDYLISNLIAYVVILVFIAAVSGYSRDELYRAFVRSRVLMVVLISVMSLILSRVLLPVKRAMLLVEEEEPIPDRLLRRTVRIFKNYRYIVLTINIVCYPLTIFLSMMLTYRAQGFIQPQQWWILLNGSLVVFAITMFQQTLFSVRSIRVKEYLRLHVFAGIRSANLTAAIAGTVFFFLLSYAATAYNNNARTIRFFREHEAAAVERLLAVESVSEREAIAASLDEDRAEFALRQNLQTLAASIVMLVTVMVGIYLFAREIRSHVGVSRKKLAEITSDGCDLSQKVVITTFNDIGLLNQDVNTLIDRNRELYVQIAESAELVREAAESLSALSDDLADHSSDMQERSERMSTESEGLETKMSGLAASSAELDRSIAAVTEAAEALDTSLAEVSSDAGTAAADSRKAAVLIRETGEQVSSLGERAAEIGTIIDLISKIGQRTTILSLNATIEAARAGSAGRGFAVVAAEVKQLAAQVNEAADQVRDLVGAIRKSTEITAHGMEEITAAASRVERIVEKIEGAVGEQSRSTQDIAEHMQSAAGDVGLISAHIGESASTIKTVSESASKVLRTGRSVSDTGELIRASASELSRVSRTLASEVSRFKLA